MPCCGVAQRFAAAAVAAAIVVARFLTGAGAPLPHAHTGRVALATALSPSRAPVRSLRADRDRAEVARVAVPGALIAAAPAVPAPPPPIAAPRFVAPLPPLPPAPPSAARARAPPRAAA
jgi:hypothetical protein